MIGSDDPLDRSQPRPDHCPDLGSLAGQLMPGSNRLARHAGSPSDQITWPGRSNARLAGLLAS